MEDSIDRIIPVDIEDEMKTSYIDYSMSVIVSRALPDVRDGLKPVHRRVLYSMNESGNTYNNPTRKCARAVGDILGKYHPHGDSSVYNTLVRLAQGWNMRYPLIQGQGNFGSIDGDSPAAMRYTESRLNQFAQEMLRDIDMETVDFQDNFDGDFQEPTVLPCRIPNLLINGAAGIAVGMATNMAPHNLTETLNACIAYIDARGEITVDELMQYVKAPDFPTGGVIYGYEGVKEAFHTGRGRIVIRGKADIEEHHGHEQIIIREIPYQVRKSDMVAKIAQLVNEKKIDGISDISDESSNKGIRIVIDIKKDANAGVVLNYLYKYSDLESYFSVNNIALVHGRPRLLNLKDLIGHFVDHRHEVVTRRAQYELRKAQERIHILEGLIIAVDNIDEVIRIIRSSEETRDAMNRLMEAFNLSELQARAIVDMRLRQLTKLDIDKLEHEYNELKERIDYLNLFLSDINMRMEKIQEECREIIDKYGDERRSEIVYASEDLNPEDFYADEDMVITISHLGYIKRTPLSEFRTQTRGGVGVKGADSRDEDFVEYIYSATMHATMMLFTATGRVYWLRVFEIPEGSKSSKGRHIQNLLDLDEENRITAFLRIKNLTTDEEFVNTHYLVFATEQGLIKKTLLAHYANPRKTGVRAINLRDDDQVVSVALSNGNCEIFLANRNGRCVRFNEQDVRPMGRTATGVRGIRLDDDPNDKVIGMVVHRLKNSDETILVISEKGYGKRSLIDDYRITKRGAKGVKTINVTDKTGQLIDIRAVEDDDNIMIINKSGVAIRLSMEQVRVMGRATQGVKMIDLNKRSDEIASICNVVAEEEEPELIDEADLDDPSEFVPQEEDLQGSDSDEELEVNDDQE